MSMYKKSVKVSGLGIQHMSVLRSAHDRSLYVCASSTHYLDYHGYFNADGRWDDDFAQPWNDDLRNAMQRFVKRAIKAGV